MPVRAATRSATRRRRRVPRPAGAALALLAGLLAARPAAGQADDLQTELAGLAAEGRVEELADRLRRLPRLERLPWLARAETSRAAAVADEPQRSEAFRRAAERYNEWILAIQSDPQLAEDPRRARLAAAQAELGQMIFNRWAAPGLDEFELTDGRHVRPGLTRTLRSAQQALEQARQTVTPLLARLVAGGQDAEEDLLSQGIYDLAVRTDLDCRFYLGWVRLYLGLLQPGSEGADDRHMAELLFRGLLEDSRALGARPSCRLGLAMALRAQGQFEPAAAQFRQALPAAEDDPVLAARVRYEWARCLIDMGQFEAARAALAPLAGPQAAQPEPPDSSLRYYRNLAALWHARSYLLEARARRREAGPADRHAAELRRLGLEGFARLAARGGPWPALLELFLSDEIDPQADPQRLSTFELLYTARVLIDRGDDAAARLRLEEAVRRADAPPHAQADALYELAACAYRLDDPRAAAEGFFRLAERFPDDPRAPEALRYAYRLMAGLADQSRDAQDYLRVAGMLRLLLERFPQHPDRLAATWWLPVALESAGQYAQAAEEFAKVPEDSPQHAEAQVRALRCRRRVLEAEYAALRPAERLDRARELAQQATRLARRLRGEPAGGSDAAALRPHAAEALIHAAELWLLPELDRCEYVLQLLEDFERDYPDDPRRASVLGLRIRALCGLGRYAAAEALLAPFAAQAAPEQVVHTLLPVAARLEERVERLNEPEPAPDVPRLAAVAAALLERIDAALAAQDADAGRRAAVQFALARMQYRAGRFAAARALLELLCAAQPDNGELRRLRALVLTAAARQNADPAARDAAVGAWGELLRDADLRTRAPQRYWEARYHLLALLLHGGRAAEVCRAIEQERIWHPELGGPQWAGRFEDLYRQARRQRGD